MKGGQINSGRGRMFERFTEKARRVIFFGRYEASQFGSLHIEAEFLLLGMLQEDPEVVSRWMGGEYGVMRLREEIAGWARRGPEISTSIDLPLSDESKHVLAYAAEESTLLAHQFIGVEHLFLGLLRESKSRAAKLLLDRGVNVKAVRKAYAKEGLKDGREVGSSVHHQVMEIGLMVVFVLEDGSARLQMLWRARIPVAGEIVSVEHGNGRPLVYEVVGVEWRVDETEGGHSSLSRVVVHVRESQSSSGSHGG
jgi:hypothetical protein